MDKKTVNLKEYRRARKEKWFAKNSQKLYLFMCEFLAHHMEINYLQAAESYQSMQTLHAEEAWDYTDLRDLIHQTIEKRLCEQIYGRLIKLSWFDSRLFSKEEVIEYCLSLYILNSINSSSGF